MEKELKKMEVKEHGEKKHYSLRGAVKAVSLASRLSPKQPRKKDKEPDVNIAQLKVCLLLCSASVRAHYVNKFKLKACCIVLCFHIDTHELAQNE